MFFFNLLPFYFLGSKVRVSRVSWTENATEHSKATAHCGLESPGGSASLFSVTWYRNGGNSGSKMLVHLQQDGLLEYGDEGLRSHLHCYRSSPTDFVLQLHRVEMEDAGMYWCKVAEWQLHGTPGKWVSQASGESQHVALTVLPSGNQGLVKRPWLMLRTFVSPLGLSLPAVFCSFFRLKTISDSLRKRLAMSLNSNAFGQTGST